MRSRYEFAFLTVSASDPGAVDPALALMGAQGWEMRGVAALQNGELAVGLQRPLDEEIPLPDGMTLAATLDEPLSIVGLEPA